MSGAGRVPTATLRKLVGRHGAPQLAVGWMMGAYTAAAATDFNCVPRARIVAVNAQARSRRAD